MPAPYGLYALPAKEHREAEMQALNERTKRWEVEKAKILATLGPLEKLQSCYLCMNSYYYDRAHDIVHVFDNWGCKQITISRHMESEIRKHNNI
jgi:hypothetical protein